MQTWILIGIMVILGTIASFLMYYINSAMNYDDAERIDEVPQNTFNQ
ncbi:hypothetical protein ACFFF5_09755 [Lederbergia wuyishanensis]|uniref:Uncharacterized protein n=1 Tax=Lederbergia wuyishanensis TaxID=1347903 RepID=A0ABU0D7H3_9BACI|nr:hypothetical protein [Lederbergia wuyishanensis]MCJ8009031.1 hypothetical protein [Lederbergia wuyishanensis]MDQ0344363.1 hypothetical protein [Lederbergia wuyishanensis]